MTMSSVYFLSGTTEVKMSPMSKDIYTSLPNKAAEGIPFQYWYDRQAVAPVMRVWQVPVTDFYQFVTWYQQQIQDVGDLTNTLDVPQRWLDYIITELAAKIIFELPKEQVDMTRAPILAAKSVELQQQGADGETDGAPIRIRPNLRAYTRG
jgi:hypothetical protein